MLEKGIIRPHAPRTQIWKSGKDMYWNGIPKTIWSSFAVEFQILDIDAKKDSSNERDKPRMGVEELAGALQTLHSVDLHVAEKVVASTG